MATITGSEVLAKALRTQGVDTMFYLMGGPMLETEAACIQLGIRAIDHRHEQAASFAAHAYTRVTRRPGVCMGCSGPGATNLVTGVATAFTDCAPLVAIGGASPRVYQGMEAFQEIDQLGVMKPITKWAERIFDAKRIPDVDVVLAVGTRFDWMIQFGRPPRFAADLKVIHVDINPSQLGHNREVDVPIAGDARAVLEQLRAEAEGKVNPRLYAGWTGKLRTLDAEKSSEMDKAMSNDNTPIHPLRLCKEVRDFLRRDALLVVDGQEILNFGRQAIPTYVPGHRLNSGAFGTMGVGLPYGVGAKVAKPDTQVLVLHGDGSFGINAMDIDTAVRHKIPVVVVISNNGGWTADAPWTRPLPKPGRNLGHTRYDKVAQELGAHGEFVEKPHEIRPALERAYASGKPAVVNVITDNKARAQTVRFSAYTT